MNLQEHIKNNLILGVADKKYVNRASGLYDLPRGLSWLTDTMPGIDIYRYGFVCNPTHFFDPTASTSRNLGTYKHPFNDYTILPKVFKGDVRGLALGVKRGTETRVGASTNGINLKCYGTNSDPFFVVPYDDAEALPIITGGIVRTDWVVHAGSIYKITGLSKDTDVYQNDVRLSKKSSLGNVTGRGMSCYSSGTMYIWPYDDENPNLGQVEIVGSDNALKIEYSDVATSGYIQVVGMHCRKGRDNVLEITNLSGASSITAVGGLYVVGCKTGQSGFDASSGQAGCDGVKLYGFNNSVLATNSYMIGNESYDCINNAFETAFVDGLVHEWNYGHDVGGNSVLELWATCKNTKVRYNIGKNSSTAGRLGTSFHASGFWSTIYTDSAGTAKSHAAFVNNTFEFNVIAEATNQLGEIYGGTGHVVQHNTFYNSASTSTNRGLNLFRNAQIAGTCSAFVANNVIVVGNSGTRQAIEIIQGTANNDQGVSITATVTGDNNWYLAHTTPSPGCKANATSRGYSQFSEYQAVAAPFDANSQAKVPTAGNTANVFVDSNCRPLTAAIKTGGKTGLTPLNYWYADGYPYDDTSCAVGAYAN